MVSYSNFGYGDLFDPDDRPGKKRKTLPVTFATSSSDPGYPLPPDYYRARAYHQGKDVDEVYGHMQSVNKAMMEQEKAMRMMQQQMIDNMQLSIKPPPMQISSQQLQNLRSDYPMTHMAAQEFPSSRIQPGHTVHIIAGGGGGAGGCGSCGSAGGNGGNGGAWGERISVSCDHRVDFGKRINDKPSSVPKIKPDDAVDIGTKVSIIEDLVTLPGEKVAIKKHIPIIN